MHATAYNCTCNDGYEFDIDVATCTDNIGFFNCTCFDGFEGEGFEGDCAEIDECNPVTGTRYCDFNAVCDNIIGSYECTSIEGYDGNGFTGNCTDIDESDMDRQPLLNANDEGTNCTD